MPFDQIFEHPSADFAPVGQVSRGRGKPPSKAGRLQLQFVNVQSPDDVGSTAYQKTVRSHVMRLNRAGGRRRSRSPPAKRHRQAPSIVDPGPKSPPSFWGDTYGILPQDTPILLENVSKLIVSFQVPFHVAGGASHPWIQVYISSALGSETLMNALIAVTLLCSSHRARDVDLRTRIEKHRSRAVQLLLDGFARPQQDVSDEAISTVALLATYDIIANGDMHAIKVHMEGLRKMVTLRGGLQALGMDGLPKTLTLWTDQYNSLYVGRKPFYTMRPLPGLEPSYAWSPDGQTFIDGYRKMCRQGLLEIELVDTLEELGRIMGLFEWLAQGECVCVSMDFLLDERQRVESALRPTYGLGSSVRSFGPICCATSKLYAAGILSRMPFDCAAEEAAKLPRLGEELRQAILQKDLDLHWAQCSWFLVWVLGAASFFERGSPFRSWIIEESRSFIMRLSGPGLTLLDFKYIMRVFVWADAYCDAESEDLWAECCQHASLL